VYPVPPTLARHAEAIKISLVLCHHASYRHHRLPGFLGVTKVAVDAFQLRPNESEVDNPIWQPADYPAETPSQLRATIAGLLDSPVLSVPLFANLYVLRELLQSDASFLDFLFSEFAGEHQTDEVGRACPNFVNSY
jgi:hypothetical protein